MTTCSTSSSSSSSSSSSAHSDSDECNQRKAQILCDQLNQILNISTKMHSPPPTVLNPTSQAKQPDDLKFNNITKQTLNKLNSKRLVDSNSLRPLVLNRSPHFSYQQQQQIKQ